MTTNLFSTLSIPDELQIALTNLVLATPVTEVPWTPVVSGFMANTLVVSNARATRIGNTVTAFLQVTGTATTSSSTLVSVTMPLPASVPTKAIAQGNHVGTLGDFRAVITAGNLVTQFTGLSVPFAFWAIVIYETP